MATAYLADNFSDPFPSAPMADVKLVREFKFTLSAAFVINDTVKLSPIKGAGHQVVIDDYYIDLPDLDSGGTPALVIDIGDDDDDDEFVAASTKGQAAAIITAPVDGVKGIVPKLYSADKNFILLIDTAPQTGAATGTIRGWMEYHLPGVASLL